MSEPQKVRVGFVGVGAMGQAAHLRNYAGLPGCEVVALAEVREEVGRKVAARYGIPNVYTSHEELLEKEQLDAIVASQPFTRHGILIPELAQKGVPIFVEKPIAGSQGVGRQILEALAASGSWAMVGYHKRCDPAMEYARAEIARLKEGNEVGAMRYIRLTMPPGDWIAGGFNDNLHGEGLPHFERDPGPDDVPEEWHEGHNHFVNFYIHQVNLLRWLLGESYEVSYADPAGRLFVGHSVSGVPCTIEMAPYRTTVEWDESALVCFEGATVKVDLPAPLAYNRPGRVEVFTDTSLDKAPMLHVPTLPWVHAMRNQAVRFLEAVRGERVAPCLAPEALEDMRIAREYMALLKGF